jgi:hypothetical protein
MNAGVLVSADRRVFLNQAVTMPLGDADGLDGSGRSGGSEKRPQL